MLEQDINQQRIKKLEEYIWNSLFAMSRAYDDVETQGCSFRLLILSISYMLSVIGVKHKINHLVDRFCNTINFFEINNCMCDDGFKQQCPSTSELYEFMKKYYNYCMSRESGKILSYKEMDKIYDIDKMTKNWWGPNLWNVLHYFGAYYCPDDKYEYFVAYKCMIMCLVHTLPCKICRVHFLKHTTKPDHNIDKFSKSNFDLLFWSFTIHNSANSFLNKRIYLWDEAIDQYIPK